MRGGKEGRILIGDLTLIDTLSFGPGMKKPTQPLPKQSLSLAERDR